MTGQTFLVKTPPYEHPFEADGTVVAMDVHVDCVVQFEGSGVYGFVSGFNDEAEL